VPIDIPFHFRIESGRINDSVNSSGKKEVNGVTIKGKIAVENPALDARLLFADVPDPSGVCVHVRPGARAVQLDDLEERVELEE